MRYLNAAKLGNAEAQLYVASKSCSRRRWQWLYKTRRWIK